MTATQSVRGALVLGYLGVACSGFLVDWQPRAFWTVLLPLLPLAIVLMGFSTWRKICPLAFWGELGRRFNKGTQRRLPRALEVYVFPITFGVLLAMLALRLVATNGDGRWLGGLLVGLGAAAFLTNRVFTGKTWCNYVCPVGLVEVIYTDASAVGAKGNSQCAKCTACRKNCPDIDQENAYWKELENRWRRFCVYAFPGLVLGFYCYYWLRAGDWEAYFDGRWTREPATAALAFGPGFFFAPQIPAALAALLTLAGFSLAAWALFSLVEKLVERFRPEPEARQHLTVSLASFAAFNAFYAFAGAPSLRQLPGGLRAAAFAAPVVATIVLMTRWQRSRERFLEDRGAARLLRNWPFEGPPPQKPAEVFAFYKARSEAREKGLGAYRSTVREMLADGLVSATELKLLTRLRSELGVSQAEHEKLMGELSAEERRLLEQPSDVAAQLQERGHEKALADALLRGASADALEQLRFEHGLALADHERILARVRAENAEVGRRHAELLEQAATCGARISAVCTLDDDAARFLGFALAQEQKALLARAAQLGVHSNTAPAVPTPPAADALRALLTDASPWTRAAALTVTARHFRPQLESAELERARGDASELVREVVSRLDGAGNSLTTIDRIISLWRVPLFASLEPALLHEVSGVVHEQSFAAGEAICVEGEKGDDMYVLQAGNIVVDVGGKVVAERGPGEVVGELAVIDGGKRMATVRAQTPASVLRIDGKAFRERLLPRPDISFQVLSTVARRLRER